MTQLIKEKNLLRKVDIIKDKEYILSELKKSESEKGYSFEESYKYNLEKLNELAQKYEKVWNWNKK